MGAHMTNQDNDKMLVNGSRRRLLKLLAGTIGAASAFAITPENWRQPRIRVGAMPAHAALSNLEDNDKYK